MNLRFINRDGKMILQHRSPCDFKGTNPPFKIEELWADVPTHQEPKVDMLVEELANGFRNYADIGKNYEWSLADYAVKFFRSRMLPPWKEYPNDPRFEKEHISAVAHNACLRSVNKALFGEA